MTVHEEGFLLRKHQRLLNIAGVANGVAWLVLIVQVLWVVVRGLSFASQFNGFPLQQYLTADPLDFVMFVLDLSSRLVTGVVSWLVLKGISLGLKMIVETDLNYRAVALEGSDE